MQNRWYKDLVFYQIWPRSFCDGNGDGIGDLWGVLSKLDYLESLGVTGIWFSPLYPSPNADYGYDVSDYRSISPEYGTMEVFEQVLVGAHARGMKVIMDLVINHTSDEHPWFKASRADPAGPYHNYYFWRKGKGAEAADRKDAEGSKRAAKAKGKGKGRVSGKKRDDQQHTPASKPPNNWDSLFEGKAWEYDESLDEYYLHLFACKQPDLNMDNPEVRAEIEDIMRFWLDKGVDGFREDVITFISKAEGLPDDHFVAGAQGFRLYSDGPHVHEYLTEFKEEVLDHYDCMTVGEGPMMTPKRALPYIGEGPRQELDMMFHFQHMEADCWFTEYNARPFSLRKLKKVFTGWQDDLDGKAWNTLYLENHDHPRVISRFGSEKYHAESGKMLAACYLFQKGTPFVFQGQEIGMTNISLPTIDDYPDVAAKKQYLLLKGKRKTEEEAMDVVRKACRDNARTPMQWSGTVNAGFSSVAPWFTVNPTYPVVNVAAQTDDPDSLLNFYRAAIALRKSLPVIRDGAYRELDKSSTQIYAYVREPYAKGREKGRKEASGLTRDAYGKAQEVVDNTRVLVVCSFSEKPAHFRAPKGYDLEGCEPALRNYPDAPVGNGGFTLRPYETRVYVLRA